jgi:hypothetical protein
VQHLAGSGSSGKGGQGPLALGFPPVSGVDPVACHRIGHRIGLRIGGVAAFLWEADGIAIGAALAWAAALTAGLWCVGAVLQGRVSVAAVLVLDALALAVLFVN